VAVGAVVTVVKPERFLRRLFQTACGNHQEEVAEGHLLSISTAVAVSTALSAACFSFSAVCCKKKKAPGCRLEPKTRVINRLCSGANQ